MSMSEERRDKLMDELFDRVRKVEDEVPDNAEIRMRDMERQLVLLPEIRNQIQALHKMMETYYQELRSRDEQMTALMQRILQVELTQSTCIEKQKIVSGFAANRLGNLLDWMFKAGVLAFLIYAVKEGTLK